MVEIDKVAESIIQKYKGDSTLTDALTGLYLHQAPQDATLPYGIFYFNGITTDEIMGGADSNVTDVAIQFSLFDDSDDGCSNMAALITYLTTTFDWTDLVMDGWNCVKFSRENVMPLTFTDEVWQAVIDYSLWMQKE